MGLPLSQVSALVLLYLWNAPGISKQIAKDIIPCTPDTKLGSMVAEQPLVPVIS